MVRKTLKEIIVAAGLIIGAVAFAVLQGAGTILIKEGVVSFLIARNAARESMMHSASATPEVLPAADHARPVAVMIDNHPDALPQSGVAGAEEVWELPVEGGLTRLMAVFKTTASGKIGPVRSARPYFVDLAKSLDAVYAHVGGSDEALAMAGAGSVDNVDEFKDGTTFWRDHLRQAPHNAYTSDLLLRTLMKTRGWRDTSEDLGTAPRSLASASGTPTASISLASTRGARDEAFR